MLAFLLGLFRLVSLFGKGHHGVALENLALRQQLSIYKRKQKRPRLVGRDRWFWITLSLVWKGWRRVLLVVHPDTVARWQRQRFRRYWSRLSKKPGRTGTGSFGNVASLLLARAFYRRPEDRPARGARSGRARLVQQFLTESLLVAGARSSWSGNCVAGRSGTRPHDFDRGLARLA